MANCPAACSSTPPDTAAPPVLATAKETAIWNSTRRVASLKRLSAGTSDCTGDGSDSRRPSALTATGPCWQHRPEHEAHTRRNRRRPDLACLQEIKTSTGEFPAGDFDAVGYQAAAHGQAGRNGVAVLSRMQLRDMALRVR